MDGEKATIVDELLSKAVSHHEAGRIEEARDSYLKLLEIEPRHSQALDLAGLLCMECGEIDAARDFYEFGLEVDPNNVGCRVHLGLLHLNSNELEEAEYQFRECSNISADVASPHFYLGLLLRGIPGRRSEAFEQLHEAVILDATNTLYLSWRGTLAWELGDVELALISFKEALEHDSTNVEAVAQLGSVFIELEEFTMAEDCFRAGLKQDPKHAGCREKLAGLLGKLGKTEEARQEFARVLTEAPNHAQARASYAVFLATVGETEAANQAGNEAIGMDDRSVDVHLSLLEMFNRLGNIEGVKRMKEKLEAMAPDDVRVNAVIF